MLKPRMMLLNVMLLTALVGCASSKPISQPGVIPIATPQAEIPAPAAWAMEPPSSSLQKLDALFSISDKISSATKPN